MPTLNRFKILMPAVLANVATIFSTLTYKWSMLEVTMVYCWEFLIIVLLTLLKIIKAKGAFKTKTLTFLVAFLMYGLFLSTSFAALYLWLNNQSIKIETHLVIFVCTLFFLYDHCLSYFQESKTGVYNKLLSDGELTTPMWRILPLYILIPLLIMHHNNGINYSLEQFIIGLVVIAIINVAMHVVHFDQFKNKLAIANASASARSQ